MNKTLPEALAFAEALKAFLPKVDERIQPFVIPPFTAVREVKKVLGSSRVKVGAQNMHWADAGAWTGEISPLMLKDCGIDMVELGHSERREHFGETDKTVGLKVAAAVRHGFVPLVCVGETLAEREAGEAEAVLERQVRGALQFLEGESLSADLIFAYEPVWAIGDKGIPATAGYAGERHRLIKHVAAALLPAVPPVLYGGSVNPGNAAELVAEPHIDGLFIGRAAWQAEGYIGILGLAASAL
jgi:triosephosphate isomerase